jgi:hypothetical protein
MTRWFRFYDGAIHDAKLLRLSDASFRAWVTLLCVASKNNGLLPPAADIAVELRCKPALVAGWITELSTAGLLDKTSDGFTPHNWNERQYKSDSSAERMKRHRDKKRDATSDVTVTVQNRTEADTEQKEDKIGEARAPSRLTEGSKALASSLWKALGYESALSIPPELAGTDWRAIEWERAGWTADLIEAEAKRIGPGKPLVYYEKVFATSFAKRQAPLPVVEIKEAETVTVTHGRRIQETNSLVNAARKHAEQGISFGPRPELPTLRSITGGADVRLLPQSGGDGPGDLCGGSGGGPERLSASGD